MALKTSDIIQIDATVIAGLLILLTITTSQTHDPSEMLKIKWLNTIALVEIVPFSASAFFVLMAEKRVLQKKVEFDNKAMINSIVAMTVGFAYMILLMVLYLFVFWIKI